ncbi:hypothetical protein MPTA5024_18485 [Microbispora sp. ATCC PTA-5024]|nr:hypothetical protein MPTA5024_18485 [Microbispora sp. ATCC PTA-5024]
MATPRPCPTSRARKSALVTSNATSRVSLAAEKAWSDWTRPAVLAGRSTNISEESRRRSTAGSSASGWSGATTATSRSRASSRTFTPSGRTVVGIPRKATSMAPSFTCSTNSSLAPTRRLMRTDGYRS